VTLLANRSSYFPELSGKRKSRQGTKFRAKNLRHKVKENNNRGKQQHFGQNPILHCLQTFPVIWRQKNFSQITKIQLNGGIKYKNGLKFSHSIGKRISFAMSANRLPRFPELAGKRESQQGTKFREI
jgi:hypothetical protein